MNLIRFQNPHHLANRNLADELFSNFLRNDYHENYFENCGNQPATNVLETEKDYRIELLLPGFRKEDVRLNYHKNVLTIKVDNEGGKEKKNKTEGFRYEHREFGAFNFEKSFKIPNSANIENISAKFENGILHIVLPKKEEAVEKEPVQIAIK